MDKENKRRFNWIDFPKQVRMFLTMLIPSFVIAILVSFSFFSNYSTIQTIIISAVLYLLIFFGSEFIIDKLFNNDN